MLKGGFVAANGGSRNGFPHLRLRR